MVFEGLDAVKVGRAIVGATVPGTAELSSLVVALRV